MNDIEPASSQMSPYHLFLPLCLVLVGMGPVELVTPSEQEQHRNTVTGVLERLDLDHGKGELRTDLGKPIFFEVVHPEFFQQVQVMVGKRVTIELDAEGRAVKVMAVPPAELEQP